MRLTEEVEKIINESETKDELEAAIDKTDQLLKSAAIVPTELQWTILINHINEMIKRSKANEKMTGVDPVMFDEVSETALQIADELTAFIGNLPIDEMYVLSIHFESAKQN